MESLRFIMQNADCHKIFADGQTRRLPSHADELSYQFQMKELFAAFFQPIGHGHEDEAFSHEFVATWAKFADTGYIILVSYLHTSFN